jgi:hypothetical protein
VLGFPRRIGIQIQLQDILALVVGYAMAAVLFRAFWPTSAPPILLGLPLLALYGWLGLAMSGPIILLRGRARADRSAEAQAQVAILAARTWAESAWILIGIYWIVLGLFVIPSRLHDFQLRDAVLFGAVPVLVALLFRFLGQSPKALRNGSTPWTHRAAVMLLATWPIAWACLVLLGNSLR